MAEQPACILLPDASKQALHQAKEVNWLTFGIAYDGPASTASQYFRPEVEAPQQQDGPSTSSSSNSQWIAHFRGRQLKGVAKSLPEGFQGLVLKPAGSSSNASTSDTQQRSWQAVGSFSDLRVWGHDQAPAATDPLMRAIDWLALADQIHQPVSASAVDEELKQMEAHAATATTGA